MMFTDRARATAPRTTRRAAQGARRAPRQAAHGSCSRRVHDPPRGGHDRRQQVRRRSCRLPFATGLGHPTSFAPRRSRSLPRPRASPSATDPTRAGDEQAAPALNTTTSRRVLAATRPARRGRCRRSRAASPPARSSAEALRRRNPRVHVEGVHRAVTAFRDLRVAGRGELVEAVRAVHHPRALRAQEQQRRATSSVSSGRGTPTICRAAPAGLVSGPSRLKAVRTPRSSAGLRRVLHRRVKGRREEERHARLVQHPLDHRRLGADS